MKIAIVTDSTCYLSDKQIHDNDITVIPITVVLDGVTYDEGKDITTNEFFKKMSLSSSFPSTSQPPLGEIVNIYESLANKGYTDIISIHIASTISGMVNTLRSVAKTINDTNIYVFDSHITTALMGTMVLKASEMAKEGYNPHTIIEVLKRLRNTADCYFVVNDLKNLVKGGRLSNAAAFIGGLLQIKPILTFNDNDKIVAIEKIRSLKRAYNRIECLFNEKLSKINYPIRCFSISDDKETALSFKKRINDKYPNIPVDVGYFGPVIGSHLGIKSLGFGWMEDYKKIKIDAE